MLILMFKFLVNLGVFVLWWQDLQRHYQLRPQRREVTKMNKVINFEVRFQDREDLESSDLFI